jgi:hypothetical protein
MTFGGATFSFILLALGSALSLSLSFHLKRDWPQDAALVSLKFIAVDGLSKASNKSVFFSAGKQLAAVAR